ncbi:MAG: ABC transporter permease [Alkaliphilus sp.]
MTVFKTNLLRIIRKKSNFVSMLLVPIIFTIIIFLLGGTTEEYRIAVVDNDGTRLTQLLVESLEESNTVIMFDEESARQALIDREVGYVINIPANFTNDIIEGNEPMLVGGRIQETEGAFSSSMFIESFVNAVEKIAMASEGVEEKFYLGVEEYLRAPFGITVETFEFDHSRGAMLTGIGFLTMGMLFFSVSAVRILIEDKTSKTLHRLMATPLTIKQYMLENIACFLIVLLAQITIVFLFLNVKLEIGWESYFVNLYLLAIIFAMLSVAFGIGITGIVKNTRQASTVSTLLITPMIMIGGGFWPSEIMPEFMQRLGYISPVSWFIKAGQRIIEGASLFEVHREIGILLLFALAFFIIGSFKKVDIAA